MITVFLCFLSYVWQSTPLILLVLLLRVIFIKGPKRFRQIWWGLIVLSFLPIHYPFAIQVFLPIINKLFFSRDQLSTLLVTNGLSSFSESSIDDVLLNQVSASQQVTQPLWLSVLSRVWAVGVLAFLITALVKLYLLHRHIQITVEERGNIVLSNNLSTPFVVGIIRPIIYLPSSLSKEERDYVLLHERVHIQKYDQIKKVIAYCFLSLFSFHPIICANFARTAR